MRCRCDTDTDINNDDLLIGYQPREAIFTDTDAWYRYLISMLPLPLSDTDDIDIETTNDDQALRYQSREARSEKKKHDEIPLRYLSREARSEKK